MNKSGLNYGLAQSSRVHRLRDYQKPLLLPSILSGTRRDTIPILRETLIIFANSWVL